MTIGPHANRRFAKRGTRDRMRPCPCVVVSTEDTKQYRRIMRYLLPSSDHGTNFSIMQMKHSETDHYKTTAMKGHLP